MKTLIFLCFLSLSGFSQAQEPEVVETVMAMLKPGEPLNFENKAVKFIEVISDSRCPRGVTCIWAGEAKLRVGIYENGKCIAEKILTIAPGAAIKYELNKLFGIADFSLSILSLQPYPEIEMPIDPSTYRLRIRLSKAQEDN